MNRSIRLALATVLALSPALKAAPPRIPLGIYALVQVEKVVSDKQACNNPSPGPGLPPLCIVLTPQEMDSYLQSFYTGLLKNPAVAGLALQFEWRTVNPTSSTYYWNYVDDAFSSVHQWNTNNPDNPKTIQLIVNPGWFTPDWVFGDIKNNCDPLFTVGSAQHDCGKATFQQTTECALLNCSPQLPMPWDPAYIGDWNAFLMALAKHKDDGVAYGSDPSLVSIAVAGPTAASAEMILPNSDNTTPSTFGAADDMWSKLLTNKPGGSPLKPDDEFVTDWDNAIDSYGTLFSGLTLVVTTGNGLPDLTPSAPTPTLLVQDCPNPGPDCAAEANVLLHFAHGHNGGTNYKATQTSGIRKVPSPAKNLGIDGVTFLSGLTMGEMSPSCRILGGGQFNNAFSVNPDLVSKGVTVKEQAAWDALTVFFANTPAASYYGGTPGSAPLNYLQIWYEDIQYATTHPTRQTITGPTVPVNAQDLLDTASSQLLNPTTSETEPTGAFGTTCVKLP